MKAGTALGLLAGLGALNAMRGGRDGTGPRFTGLIDMLDGGGAGKSGDKFEGGGLLSMLGNLFMKPIQAQQRVEDIASRTSARDRSTSIKPVLRPTMTTGVPITEYTDSLLPPVIPVTSDPRDFLQGTEPSMLTEAQKEAIVMGQDIPPAVFDPRDFDRGSEPSTLTENQRLRAAGILAGQAAMRPITQAQLQGGAESLANASTALNSAVSRGAVPDALPALPDPMGLLPRQTMIPPAATNMDAPDVGSLLNVPSSAPNQAQTMLQSLSATIPPAAEKNDPAIVQGYKDYVMAGGTADYKTYYRSRPEYIAERQLFEETNGTLFDLPEDQRKKLISDRADIIRRETPKDVPFTGPAF